MKTSEIWHAIGAARDFLDRGPDPEPTWKEVVALKQRLQNARDWLFKVYGQSEWFAAPGESGTQNQAEIGAEPQPVDVPVSVEPTDIPF